MKITIKNVEKLSKVSIEELNINDGRSYNVLKRAKLSTIGDIIEKWDRLDKFPQAGAKTIKNIKNAVINYYLENANDDQLCRFINDFNDQCLSA